MPRRHRRGWCTPARIAFFAPGMELEAARGAFGRVCKVEPAAWGTLMYRDRQAGRIFSTGGPAVYGTAFNPKATSNNRRPVNPKATRNHRPKRIDRAGAIPHAHDAQHLSRSGRRTPTFCSRRAHSLKTHCVHSPRLSSLLRCRNVLPSPRSYPCLHAPKPTGPRRWPRATNLVM